MTQWVSNGDTANLIEDSAPYTDPLGTRYPGNWPKVDLPELAMVMDTPQPADPDLIVTGSRIELLDGVPMRVWETAPRPAPGPGPVPASISKRQFLLAAYASGLIPEADALAAASVGAIPPVISVVLNTLPVDTQVGFRITWASMAQVDRDHPFVPIMAQAFDKNDAEIDQFFRDAAKL